MSDSKLDKMDMSLDDIIQMNRTSRGPGRGGGGGRPSGGFRRGGRGGQQRGGRFERRRSGDTGGGVARGGVQRRRGAPSGGSSYSRPRQVPDVWKHDLYEDSDVPEARPLMSLTRNLQRDVNKRQAKLIISNLDFGVNDQDIEELFAEFGNLKRFAVHYDKSGRSLGTADVEYEHMEDAIKAMKQYNNVPLDGKPMKIELDGDNSKRKTDVEDRPRGISDRLGQINNSSSNNNNGYRDNYNPGPRRRPAFDAQRNRSQGGRNQQGSNRRGQRGGGGGGGGRGRGGRGREAVPTREELDAELDAYNAKMETD